MKSSYVLCLFSLMVVAFSIGIHDTRSFGIKLVQEETSEDTSKDGVARTGFGNGAYVFNVSVFSFESKSVKARRKLRRIFARMSSLVNLLRFDDILFESQQKKILHDISSVHQILESSSPSPQTLERLKHVRYMFQVMANAIMYIDYSQSFEQHHILIYRMIELDVRILSFYDDRGKFEFKEDGYAEAILVLWNDMVIWETHFNALKFVPSDLRGVFEEKTVLVKRKLQFLASNLPKQEFWLF
ncbi:hypothetical protein JCM33374_g6191 [Metschnikowia sp. JCM 33374]|nr:hypothetical protein JCM33374_g6191 [Metschnikowia sp. JCM 33374]